MKIRFIKEYVAIDPATNAGIMHRFGEIEEIKKYAAQWLVDNGYAEEVKKSGLWKPQRYEEYYFLSVIGEACFEPWTNGIMDEYRYSIGECFKTKEAAERYRDYLKAIATVRGDKGVLTPEQAAKNGCVYYINSHSVRGLEVHGFDVNYMPVNTLSFDTKEHAQASLDNHSDEWKIITNYDWSRE